VGRNHEERAGDFVLTPMKADRYPGWDGLFVTQIALDLQSPQTSPPKLLAEVQCESLALLQLLPRDRAGSMRDYESRPSQGFVQISSPSNGAYSLNIYTREPEENMAVKFLTTD
jgi:hypothetical protein